MINPHSSRGKIEIGGQGIGLPDESILLRRAQELAHMDGRREVDRRDLDQARSELLGQNSPPLPPEVTEPTLERATSWDDLIEDSGQRLPSLEAEDEANLAEALVEEGLQEADHDLRRAAAEEYPPDEIP